MTAIGHDQFVTWLEQEGQEPGAVIPDQYELWEEPGSTVPILSWHETSPIDQTRLERELELTDRQLETISYMVTAAKESANMNVETVGEEAYYKKVAAWAQSIGLNPNNIAREPITLIPTDDGYYYRYREMLRLQPDNRELQGITGRESIYDIRHKALTRDQAMEAFNLGLTVNTLTPTV